jgi:hypothetical protein
MDRFIEIRDGLLYEKETGLPWRNRQGKLKQLKSKTSRGYRDVAGKLWHRIVWEHFNGTIPDGMVIDHHDNDVLNNKINNLRLKSSGDNIRKANNNKNNSSGYKGIYWHKKEKKWLVRLMHERKNHYIGRFDCIEEAYAEYYHAKGELHGIESLKPLPCPIAF